jgi:hypothetical protein
VNGSLRKVEAAMKAVDVMTRQVITITPNASLEEGGPHHRAHAFRSAGVLRSKIIYRCAGRGDCNVSLPKSGFGMHTIRDLIPYELGGTVEHFPALKVETGLREAGTSKASLM